MICKIENEYLRVEINSFGAELSSLKKQNDDVEYLWQGDEKYWNRKAPVLFPIVGKLKDDFYFYKNKKYEMNQHGFARDKDFSVLEQGMDYVILLLTNDDLTFKNYPFVFEFYIFYKLENNKVMTYYKVINKSDKKQYFSIGAHPAFNWPLEKGDKEDYYIEFEVNNSINSLKLEKSNISDKKIRLDLDNKKLYLNNKLFSNDALIFDDLQTKNISYKNSIDDRSIRVEFDDFKYLGLWSQTKGVPFICIEPWCGLADFIDHNHNIEEKTGINVLNKNEAFEINYSIEIN